MCVFLALEVGGGWKRLSYGTTEDFSLQML